MMVDEPDVSVNVEIEPNESEDANNNGIPDNAEAATALERATNAADDAEDAQESADNAQGTAEVALDVAFEGHERLGQLETAVVAMGQTIVDMGATLVQLKELVQANAQATATQMEVQMRGSQPEDQAPSSNHWLDRKVW